MRSQSDRGSQRDDLFGLFRRPPRVTCLSSFISLRYPSMLHVTASDIDHCLLSPHPHRPVRADLCARGTASAAQGTHRRRDYDVALPARGPNVRRRRRNSTVRCAASPTRSLSSTFLSRWPPFRSPYRTAPSMLTSGERYRRREWRGQGEGEGGGGGTGGPDGTGLRDMLEHVRANLEVCG